MDGGTWWPSSLRRVSACDAPTILNAAGALAWYVHGRVLRTRNLNARSVESQAMLFDRVAVPVVRRLERLVRPPFGQSLILVAQAQSAST